MIRLLPLIRPRQGCFRGTSSQSGHEKGTDVSSHLPLLFIGMEHLQLSTSNLAEEFFLAAEKINPTDPLLLNELGVIAYNKDE